MTSTPRDIFDAGAKKRSVMNATPQPLYLRKDIMSNEMSRI